VYNILPMTSHECVFTAASVSPSNLSKHKKRTQVDLPSSGVKRSEAFPTRTARYMNE